MDPWAGLIRAVREAGHYTQFLSSGNQTWLQCVEHWSEESGYLHGRQFQVLRDTEGDWYVTVFGEEYYRLPERDALIPLCLDLMRGMGPCLDIPESAISLYGLIQTEDPCPENEQEE